VQCSVFILLQNYVYFGDNQDPVIYICDKTSTTNISSYRLWGRGGVTDMAMYASDVQPSAASKYATVRTLRCIKCWQIYKILTDFVNYYTVGWVT